MVRNREKSLNPTHEASHHLQRLDPVGDGGFSICGKIGLHLIIESAQGLGPQGSPENFLRILNDHPDQARTLVGKHGWIIHKDILLPNFRTLEKIGRRLYGSDDIPERYLLGLPGQFVPTFDSGDGSDNARLAELGEHLGKIAFRNGVQ